MNNQIVIRADALGKKYVIGHQGQRERYIALRDAPVRLIKGIWRTLTQVGRSEKIEDRSVREDFWALKNVSFELKRGEVLGIIGRNGAGKSTLLKILSRITEPSTGRVMIKGRVASLLEVGTGFHPELTGRENIFLNGAILGMKRGEIKRKFDEIVSFAEVEKFLDTPVKRYSSGMYTRLAFSVAAHLEPEILVVDEVLAVGDVEFQKKCLNKMSEVASGGRTILFVSHNLTAISDLCTSALLLQRGAIERAGKPQDVVAAYLEQSDTDRIGNWTSHTIGNVTLRFRVSTSASNNVWQSGEPLEITVECTSSPATRLDEFSLMIETMRGQRIGVIDYRLAEERTDLSSTVVTYAARLDNADLVSGTYIVKAWVFGPDVISELELGTIEFVDPAQSDKLSMFPPAVNGVLNFRGSVQKVPAR